MSIALFNGMLLRAAEPSRGGPVDLAERLRKARQRLIEHGFTDAGGRFFGGGLG